MTGYSEKLKKALTNCKTPQQVHDAVGKAVMEYAGENWERSKSAHKNSRRACYFSMEFLVGRAVYNNILCLGLYEETEKVLKETGRSIECLEEIEDERDALVRQITSGAVDEERHG